MTSVRLLYALSLHATEYALDLRLDNILIALGFIRICMHRTLIVFYYMPRMASDIFHSIIYIVQLLIQ